jgi:hypothetical protein
MNLEQIKNKFPDVRSVIYGGTRYCGERLQVNGIRLYVVTGDYDNEIKQYREWLVVIHEPTGSMGFIDMVENGKMYPWITKRMIKEIESFVLTKKCMTLKSCD